MQHSNPNLSTTSSRRPFAFRFGLLWIASLVCCIVCAAASAAQPPPKSMVKACNKGDFESCYYAGLNQSARNPAESRRYHALACNGGYRKGCKELHEATNELMQGNSADQSAAVAHFETACAQDYGRSCTALATALSKGTGVATDPARALTLWQKGCEHGSRIGCRRVGTAFEKGELLTKDLGRALAFFQRSCDAGLESACADTGRLLQAGVEPKSTDGGSGETGAAAAAAPLHKACLEASLDKVRGDACLRLGRLLAAGDGVPQDPVLAFKAFHMGCRDKQREACVEAGHAALAGRGVEQDDNRALGFYGTACQLRSAAGCEALCRLQCNDGQQPYACDRLRTKKWPMFASCAMPKAMAGSSR
ncbi:MAG: tetratricopeptide repeat protein [Acidobacteriota bacterium]